MILALILASFNTTAATTVDVKTKIKSLFTYIDQNIDGDLAIIVEDPSSVCSSGFILKNTESTSYKNVVSFFLSGYHAKATIRLRGELEPWAGSSGSFCRLKTVGFQ